MVCDISDKMQLQKVLTLESLLPELQKLREAGKTIATTNGCFDLLHVGHLRYLQAARETADCLVILLNTDASVKGLKGEIRPIVPEDERAELLAGLSCVDYVILFGDETPVELIKTIRPDVHVKGGDYTAETLPEAPVLNEIGTRMAFIPFIKGKSTTNIIEKIRQSIQS